MSVSRRGFLRGTVLPFSGTVISARGMEASQASAGSDRSPRSLVPPGVSEIRISSNENPLGPGKAVLDAILGKFPQAGRYPFNSTPSDRELTSAIAAKFKIKADNIVLGGGSQELLKNAVRAFTTPSRGLVTGAPSFENCPGVAKKLGHPIKEIKVDSLFRLDLEPMALENIVVTATRPGSMPRLRIPTWTIAFAFGLVHGFGFSFALRESLQFAGAHLLTSLLSFNIGVELGQLAVLAIIVPALHVLFRFVVAERIGTIILSALIAHTAWHWTGERWSRLRQFAWPTLDLLTIVALLRGLIVVVAIAAATWIAITIVSRRRAHVPIGEPAPSERKRARVEGA